MLVLQGVLLAQSGAQFAAAAAADGSQIVELCLHAVPDAPGLPADHGDGKGRCTFCLTVGHHLLAAPETSLRLVTDDSALAPWPPSDWIIANSPELRSHQPRGPPLTA